MEVGQPQPVAGNCIEGGGVDLAAEGADVGEAEVVGDNDEEVRPAISSGRRRGREGQTERGCRQSEGHGNS